MTLRCFTSPIKRNNMADSPAPDEEHSFYVSTPQGIFTASGIWFNAREEDVRSYAGAVLDHVSLEILLKRATAWLRSADVVTVLAFPALLLTIPPIPAISGAFIIHIGWKSLSPSVASRHAAALVSYLDHAVVQGLYYVLMLSILAARGHTWAVVAGLAGFLLLRWGLFQRVTDPLVRIICQQLYPLSRPDQVFRAFIVRAAVEHRVDTSHVQQITRDIFRKWHR